MNNLARFWQNLPESYKIIVPNRLGMSGLMASILICLNFKLILTLNKIKAFDRLISLWVHFNLLLLKKLPWNEFWNTSIWMEQKACKLDHMWLKDEKTNQSFAARWIIFLGCQNWCARDRNSTNSADNAEF